MYKIVIYNILIGSAHVLPDQNNNIGYRSTVCEFNGNQNIAWCTTTSCRVSIGNKFSIIIATIILPDSIHIKWHLQELKVDIATTIGYLPVGSPGNP